MHLARKKKRTGGKRKANYNKTLNGGDVSQRSEKILGGEDGKKKKREGEKDKQFKRQNWVESGGTWRDVGLIQGEARDIRGSAQGKKNKHKGKEKEG